MKRRARGSGSIRREGGGWAITYGPREARQYESGLRTKLEAEQRLALLRAEDLQRRLGRAADPRRVPTLGELSRDWLDRRRSTNAAGADDASRWRRHIAPTLGHLRPDEVDTARIRSLVESLRAILAPGTIRVVVAVLSSFYEDLLERQLATRNPARHLPKSILRLIKSDHDPKTTPFIEKMADVQRIFHALPSPLHVAYAIGALGGLRTGEVFALRWRSVDLAGKQILVSESRKGPTKDRDPRPVPILDLLMPILKDWKIRTGGEGLVIKPHRSDGKHYDKSIPGPALQTALEALGLAREGLGWYEATRHTFASQWAMAGRPLRELQKILGHYSVVMTERYAHLAPDYWAPGVHAALGPEWNLKPGSVAKINQDSAKTVRLGKRNR
jgi:integrase